MCKHVVTVPKRLLFPAVLVVASAGAYALRGSLFDIQLVFCFGVFIIIMSEVSINYLDLSNMSTFIFSLLPFIVFCIIYLIILIHSRTLKNIK